jgi:hypothetical protein
MKAWIGIDPGQSGAVALLNVDGGALIEDFPGDLAAAAELIGEWASNFHIQAVALERVSAMPKQGVASTFKFGTNYGGWQGIVSALSLPLLLPTPQKWQKAIGIVASDGPDTKSRSLAVARRLFPHLRGELKRKGDHGKSDALLLALFAKLAS